VSDRVSPAARRQAGEKARDRVSLADHARWRPEPDRPDPITLPEEQAATRLPQLVPIRYGRMATSPFDFYRGAALPMAADLAATPRSDIVAQLCGDAHLSNFGLFASPERTLVFDITDFDETLRGPFEWDLKRLAASLVLAGRSRGFAARDTRHAVHRAIRSYRTRMAAYATMRAIDVYYSQVDVAAILTAADKHARPFLLETVHSASHHDSIHELPKLTTVDARGMRRIVNHPPVITHPREVTRRLVDDAMADYRDTLQEDRRVLLDRYEIVDFALKVVGVGSVGLTALAVLLLGDGDDDPLFLQVKQAEASVLERFLPASTQPSPGARVVIGQRRLQATSDVFLGWTSGDLGRHHYLRQLQDQKGGAVIAAMTADDLEVWGELCGWALARGHARSGQPGEIAGYLGDDATFEHALGDFAVAYADQTEQDHRALLAAIGSGRIKAASTAEILKP
jgi:uncharacterized protein (DUF2252 family)